MEKEVKFIEGEVTYPTELHEITIKNVMFFAKLDKLGDQISEKERAFQIIAHFNDMTMEEVRSLPLDVVHKFAEKVQPLMAKKDSQDIHLKDHRIVDIDGIIYGLVPNFDRMETGAYIDLSDLLSEPEENLDKIAAILYRPILSKDGALYELTPYSTERDELKEEREKAFLNKMPYSVIRAIVNFILSHIVN